MENEKITLEEILVKLKILEDSIKELSVKFNSLDERSLTVKQLKEIVDGLNDAQVKARIFDMFFNFLKGVIFFSAFVAAATYLYEFYKGFRG